MVACGLGEARMQCVLCGGALLDEVGGSLAEEACILEGRLLEGKVVVSMEVAILTLQYYNY